jgi:hypothetical protein
MFAPGLVFEDPGEKLRGSHSQSSLYLYRDKKPRAIREVGSYKVVVSGQT